MTVLWILLGVSAVDLAPVLAAETGATGALPADR